MLFAAPYEVPEKKALGTRKGLRCKGVSDSLSEDTRAHPFDENKEEEEESLPPKPGGEEKEGRPIWGGRRVQ